MVLEYESGFTIVQTRCAKIVTERNKNYQKMAREV